MKLLWVFMTLFATGVEAQVLQTPDPEQIEFVDIRNNRRVPRDAILYQIQTQAGQTLNPALIQRDIRALYAMGHFEDITVTEEQGEEGKIIVFTVREKPLVRAIDYMGISSITESDILERYRDISLSLSQQSPYDPTTIRRAEGVILDLLAERGRQNATVQVETYEVPPGGIGVEFQVDEGPKVKIEDIEIVGNEVFSDNQIKGAMQLLAETGPISSFSSKDVYHRLKMADDLTRIQMFYRENGYVRANILEPEIEIRPTTISRTLPLIKPPFPWGIPLPFWKKEVDRMYITIRVEENDQYRLGDVQVTGNEALTEEAILAYLGLVPGEVYNETLLREGFENLTKLYGNFGYINFTPVPIPEFDDENKVVNLTINVDEDRQFIVNRINFRGNTTTRDKVIRREVMLQEGQFFSSQLWDMSLLRLNQLGYFEEITEEHADIRPSPTEPEVDITLNVTERGKNTIGFSGGVSGIGGSFLGVNYETNNFLGFGETLAVSLQGGTRTSNYVFSFSEPYLLDRPISAGFSVFQSDYRFDYARDVFGLDPDSLDGFFEERTVFEQKRRGFNMYTSYPLAVFQRAGLSFEFSNQTTDPGNNATARYFDAVRQLEGDNTFSSNDFRTRSITPSYRFSTVDSQFFPRGGQSLSLNFEFTGGPLGGNVNTFRPFIEYQHFTPMNDGRNTLAFRVQLSHLRGFSGTSAPFYERFFMGGDFDLRGFDFRQVTPLAWTEREVVDPFTGQIVVVERPAEVGGDTFAVANVEYRIPLVGTTLVLAPFLDVGNAWAIQRGQLRREIVQPDGTTRIEQVQFVPGTNTGLRASSGIELQMMLPVIQAPFRILYYYNPLRLSREVTGPVTGQPFLFQDDQKGFKFTVGRTF